ncbi:carbon-nitrogen hydrolase family protein [Neptunicella sp. SCSIO 80796]|uniref:carbon-nitrogen hydrolase family protein n=1 Tax=Neptunicella plasticusilytica TaxID=3117012 RepID=UPI003A4D7D6D
MAIVAALQMNSVVDVNQNLATVDKYLSQLSLSEPLLLVLPECFACFGGSDKDLLRVAEQRQTGVIQQNIAALAKKYAVWIVAGTVPIKVEDEQRYSASTLIFDDQGQVISEYQKIHLFDVEVNDNTRSYHESKYTRAGQNVVVFDSPFGRVGVAVCFDLRFPALFQAMGKVDVVVLPSAFTYVTGEAHWHALLKARSIELQSYLVAANQTGTHANGRQTYGHSQILSPWGEMLAEKTTEEGLILSTIDLDYVKSIRQKMPLNPFHFKHTQPSISKE